VVADPDRVATVFPALDGVTVACILLASATGSPEQLQALHGTRLEMLLFKLIDTTVRGVVYEAGGTVDPAVLAHGTEVVRSACEQSRIPYELIGACALAPGSGGRVAAAAVQRLLAG
jgi:hypothetical protein